MFALFAVSRLYPGKQALRIDSRTTDDRFVLVIDESNAAFDVPGVEKLLQTFNVVETCERIHEGGRYT